MNKKGSIQDLAIIGIILFSLSIMILMGYKVTTEFNNVVQTDSSFDTHSKEASNTLVNHYPGIIDNSFLFLAIGLSLITLILAALVRVSPIFFVLYIIALVIVIFVCGVFSNVYDEMASNPELSTLASNLTFISAILTYMPLILGVFGTLLSIIMYKSWREQG